MLSIRNKLGLFLSAVACVVVAMSSGCASGGFKLTREYAGWVNRNNVILRIVLYILTGIVFAVTLLIDMVVFNTMDFWNGTVSAGEYKFQKEDHTYYVRHEIQPGTQLKRSTIEVMDKNNKRLQLVVLNETAKGEVELTVDGQLRARANSLSELPMLTSYDAQGKLLNEKAIPLTGAPLNAVAAH